MDISQKDVNDICDELKVKTDCASSRMWNMALSEVQNKVDEKSRDVQSKKKTSDIVFWVIVVTVAISALFLVFGCAKVDLVIDEKNQITEFHSITCLKDISIDPNGVASTTSSATDGVIGGIVGFFAAWVAE